MATESEMKEMKENEDRSKNELIKILCKTKAKQKIQKYIMFMINDKKCLKLTVIVT